MTEHRDPYESGPAPAPAATCPTLREAVKAIKRCTNHTYHWVESMRQEEVHDDPCPKCLAEAALAALPTPDPLTTYLDAYPMPLGLDLDAIEQRDKAVFGTFGAWASGSDMRQLINDRQQLLVACKHLLAVVLPAPDPLTALERELVEIAVAVRTERRNHPGKTATDHFVALSVEECKAADLVLAARAATGGET